MCFGIFIIIRLKISEWLVFESKRHLYRPELCFCVSSLMWLPARRSKRSSPWLGSTWVRWSPRWKPLLAGVNSWRCSRRTITRSWMWLRRICLTAGFSSSRWAVSLYIVLMYYIMCVQHVGMWPCCLKSCLSTMFCGTGYLGFCKKICSFKNFW